MFVDQDTLWNVSPLQRDKKVRTRSIQTGIWPGSGFASIFCSYFLRLMLTKVHRRWTYFTFWVWIVVFLFAPFSIFSFFSKYYLVLKQIGAADTVNCLPLSSLTHCHETWSINHECILSSVSGHCRDAKAGHYIVYFTSFSVLEWTLGFRWLSENKARAILPC